MAGPKDTSYEEGLYHGRILLPPEYPFKPPSFLFLTENGLFQTNTKICLTISNYHPEYWQPAWGIRTALMAILSMFPVKDPASLGSLVSTTHDILMFAKKSWDFCCPSCGGQSNRQIWQEKLGEKDDSANKESSLSSEKTPLLNNSNSSESTKTTEPTQPTYPPTHSAAVPKEKPTVAKPVRRPPTDTAGNMPTVFDYFAAILVFALLFFAIVYYLT